MRTAVLILALSLLAALAPRAACAQLWLEAIGSTAPPPAPGRTASFYNLLGGQAHTSVQLLRLDAGAYAGLGARVEDGRWLTGSASAGRSWLSSVGTFSLEADLFGLRYSRPFTYSAGLLNTRATLARTLAGTELTLGASATRGRWSSRFELEGPLGQPLLQQDSSGSLSLDALELTAARSIAGGTLTLMARALPGAPFNQHGTLTFSKSGDRLDWAIHGAVLTADGHNALGGGGASIGRSMGNRWYASAEVEHQLPDQILSTVSSFGASLSFRWLVAQPKAASSPASVAPRPQVVTMEHGAGGALVAFRLPRPGAKAVSVVGSFTNWEPRAMNRSDQAWTLSLRLPAGSHQFAFLVDGEWYIPQDAPGIADDGFGRQNATIVIERL